MENAAVAIGGVGLFLVGMMILTDGLKSLAGPAQRRFLATFTKSPVTGVATGALTTAVIQSSSATTVTAVGFVGAGLLTFPQAIGIVFGANIGTTVTGWIVALLGFKLKLGSIALPMLLGGALVKLFGSGRTALIGWTIAGFSLIFIGIDTMQAGMAELEGVLTPDDLPRDTLLGRLQLVGIGMLITLVTQSSSAGVAAAMVALAAGTISLPQAAAMVIGMDIATTSTAVLASIGGSVAMRQTAFAHVAYNLFAGTLAFCLLTPFTALASTIGIGEVLGGPQFALVAFHSTFNTTGVLIALPLTRRFSRLILWLFPEDEQDLARRLDTQLLPDVHAALDALTATLEDIAGTLFRFLSTATRPHKKPRRATELVAISRALDAVDSYVAEMHPRLEQPIDAGRFAAATHALDHLHRLYHRALQQERLRTLATDRKLDPVNDSFTSALVETLKDSDLVAAEERFNVLRRDLRGERRRYSDDTTADITAKKISVEHGIDRLDSIRWLHRSAYHLWRIAHHLNLARTGEIVEPINGTEAVIETETS